MVNVKEDLTGKIFGRWTVLKQAEDYISPGGNHYSQWLCECCCNNHTKTIVRGRHLKDGSSKSCGCLSKEVASKTHKKYNQYDLSREYGIGYTTKGEEFYFDLEDYELIKDYCWSVDTVHGYIIARDYKKNDGGIKLHRLVTGVTDPYYDVDHKHGKSSRHDNRKSNLRVCTPSQNQMNRGLLPNNTSGVPGVSWHKRDKVWRAYITANKNNINLGSFKISMMQLKREKKRKKNTSENIAMTIAWQCKSEDTTEEQIDYVLACVEKAIKLLTIE